MQRFQRSAGRGMQNDSPLPRCRHWKMCHGRHELSRKHGRKNPRFTRLPIRWVSCVDSHSSNSSAGLGFTPVNCSCFSPAAESCQFYVDCRGVVENAIEDRRDQNRRTFGSVDEALGRGREVTAFNASAQATVENYRSTSGFDPWIGALKRVSDNVVSTQ